MKNPLSASAEPHFFPEMESDEEGRRDSSHSKVMRLFEKSSACLDMLPGLLCLFDQVKALKAILKICVVERSAGCLLKP